MPRSATIKKATYPVPGSNAARILKYIQDHPETTTNGIITGMKLNPSVVRKCLGVLEEKGRIEDTRDAENHHHYTAKVVY